MAQTTDTHRGRRHVGSNAEGACTGLEIVDNVPGSIFNFVCSQTTAEVNWSLTGKVRVDYQRRPKTGRWIPNRRVTEAESSSSPAPQRSQRQLDRRRQGPSRRLIRPIDAARYGVAETLGRGESR